MATDIPDLTAVDELQDGDQVVIFDQSNSATRRVTFGVMRRAVPTISTVVRDGDNVVITMTNGSSFTVNVA